MKIAAKFVIFFILYVASKTCFANPQVKYEISKLETKPLQCLNIKAVIEGITQNDFKVYFPQAGIETVDFKYDISSSIQQTEFKHIQKVINPNHGPIKFEYQLCMDNSLSNIDYPILEEDFYHFTSRNALVQPILEDDEVVDYEIKFLGFPHSDKLLTSYSLDQTQLKFEESSSAFQHFVVVGGHLNVETFVVKDAPVYIIAHGATFLDKDYVASLEKIMQAQKDFWQDTTRDFTIITLVGKDGAPMMLGRHYKNAMSMWLDNHHPDWPLAIRSISHELFHEWNGMRLKFKDDPSHFQWFSEGFTDYYGLRLARDSGAMNEVQYLEQMNDLIKVYHNHPLKNATRNEFIEKYGFDNGYYYLAMLRGHLSLFMMENENNTQLIASFDNAFKAIYHKHLSTNQIFANNNIILKGLNKCLGTPWKKTKAFIDGKAKLNLPEYVLNGRASLQTIAMIMPEYGFDEKVFIYEHKILNLKHSSAAYKAGLRENDEVVYHNLGYRSTDAISKIVVTRNKEQVEFRFKPDVKMSYIPQYRLNLQSVH